MSDISISPTQVMSTSTKPTYEELATKCEELQASIDTLRETYEFSINEARDDRDFYMNLYSGLLAEMREVA